MPLPLKLKRILMLNKYIKYTKRDNFLLVEILVSQFNLFEKSFIAQNIQRLLDKCDYPDVIFNLKSINFMDSIGIGFLISIKNTFNEKKKEMLVVTDNSKVLDVFASIKVNRFFKIFKTIEEAENHLCRQINSNIRV